MPMPIRLPTLPTLPTGWTPAARSPRTSPPRTPDAPDGDELRLRHYLRRLGVAFTPGEDL